MPVRVEKRNRLWRIVEPSGRIAKTEKGKARDGGGHFSAEKAAKQASAMNDGEKKRKTPPRDKQMVSTGTRG